MVHKKNICDYGCGQEAIHQFKNGKWCCNKSQNSCSKMKLNNSNTQSGDKSAWYGKKHSNETIEKMRTSSTGKKHSEETKQKLSKANKGKKHSEETKQKLSNISKNISEITRIKMSNSQKGRKHSNETIEKMRTSSTGKKHSEETKQKISILNTGRKRSEETKKKIKISGRLLIDQFKEKYPTFAKEEEMRYNPDKPGEKEIQVHCKNSKCENSKEKGGWFIPSGSQLSERIRQIEIGNGGSYFYCSQECKDECILYNLHSDPNKENNKPYTQEEYNTWKQVVLEQDNYECQKCESKKDLHCHHIQPVKTYPHLALDPTNGIVLCKKCHYKYGHQDECSTGNLAKRIC